MLKQAINKVFIEGILSETNLDYKSYMKDGKTMEAITGTVTVLVEKEVNGIPESYQIEVHYFNNKYTKQGKENPSYNDLLRVKNEFKSIASCGSREEADKVRITGEITMNEFYGRDGKLVSSPRVRASFINKATGRFNPKCDFEMTFTISNMKYVVDADGVEVEPKKLEITGIVPRFGGAVDVMKFYATSPNVISVIEGAWKNDDTVKAGGRLNFNSKTETYLEPVDFGEPVERVRTVSTRELIIARGNESPLEGDYANDIDELTQALRERKARLEALKDKKNNSPRKAPAKNSSLSGEDFGF